MAGDLISRSAFLHALHNAGGCGAEKGSWDDGWDKAITHAISLLEEAPAVDAVPVVHGRWIHDINNLYGCSECGERETMSHKKLKNYCPNCGAKMDGGN